jgi:hypothetical protein
MQCRALLIKYLSFETSVSYFLFYVVTCVLVLFFDFLRVLNFLKELDWDPKALKHKIWISYKDRSITALKTGRYVKRRIRNILRNKLKIVFLWYSKPDLSEKRCYNYSGKAEWANDLKIYTEVISLDLLLTNATLISKIISRHVRKPHWSPFKTEIPAKTSFN